jgi:hypothetical protein
MDIYVYVMASALIWYLNSRYFMPAAMNEENRRIKPNDELSDLDKAYITIFYPPELSATNGAQWTIEHALDVTGLDDAAKKLLLEVYQTGGWDKLRVRFTVALREARKDNLSRNSIRQRASASLNWIGGFVTRSRASTLTDTTLSPSAQAIENGFRSMQNSSGTIDPRISYGRIPPRSP